MKNFELTVPQQYLDYINKEIKKPKPHGTELLEPWLERELDIENPGVYGNLPTDESYVTVMLLENGDIKLSCQTFVSILIASHVRPEPHAHKIHNEDILYCWLDMKTNGSCRRTY